MWPLIIAAAAMMAKNELVDKPEAKRKRKLDAELTSVGDLTGHKGGYNPIPDTLSAGIDGAMMGASFGQNMQNAESARGLQEAQAGWLNRGGGMQTVANSQTAAPKGNPWALGEYTYDKPKFDY